MNRRDPTVIHAHRSRCAPAGARRRVGFFVLSIVLLAHPAGSGALGAAYRPVRGRLPAISREFRGAWLATVHNLDWPSRPGLSAARQREELAALLDRATAIGLNAVVFQVRPACDAVYRSSIEPWSPFLTGAMGEAPSPAYDPLEFAVAEAHRRGLELHAWFNPYRARASQSTRLSAGHIARRHPELVRPYGSLLWLDPGAARVREHTLAVILDVVQRYDIDGVHLDDYFYPYPVKGRGGTPLPFPDDRTHGEYRSAGGRLERGAWRRANVNRLVTDLRNAIRSAKPWVRFGISPFGIWRPGVPDGIEAGIDSVRDLGSDARYWLDAGLVDYLAPQLYWSIDAPGQSYSTLLRWWASQCPARVLLWPGIATERIGPERPASEIVRQIELARARSPVSGHIHWNLKALVTDRRGIASLLTRSTYSTLALPPAQPGTGLPAPPAPVVETRVAADGATVQFRWEASRSREVRSWAVQTRAGGRWALTVVGGSGVGISFPARQLPDIVAVRAVGRGALLGPATVLERR